MLIDISRPIMDGALVYPGDPPTRIETLATVADDGYALSALSLCLHTATHLDAPAHFLSGTPGIADLPLERFCLTAVVVDCGEAGYVSAEHVRQAGLAQGEALLFKTSNSTLPYDRMPEAWVYLTEEAAAACVEAGAGAVGLDFLDVEAPGSGHSHPVHQTLLGSGVLIIEGLDLSQVEAGRYRLFCFPLLIPGAEAGPCRAVLETLE